LPRPLFYDQLSSYDIKRALAVRHLNGDVVFLRLLADFLSVKGVQRTARAHASVSSRNEMPRRSGSVWPFICLWK
jgi:hypothetical protein